MQLDKIIYCNDVKALQLKLKEEGYYDEETQLYNIKHDLLPIIYNGNTSLSEVRKCVLNLDDYPMLEDLGSYESILLPENEDKLAKYKSVYDYTKPRTWVDEDGNEHSKERPFEIGRFA